MKYQTIPYTDTFETISVINYQEKLPLPGKPSEGSKIVAEDILTTKIITDGHFVRRTKKNTESIIEYTFNNKKIQQPVNTLIKEDIKITDATYIIKVTIIKEPGKNKLSPADKEIIKETELYVIKPIKLRTLKNVKKAFNLMLKDVTKTKKPKFNPILSSDYDLTYEEESKNVYRLIKK